jgi:hypothetical protein
VALAATTISARQPSPRSTASTVAGTSTVSGTNQGRAPAASVRSSSACGDSSATTGAGSGSSWNRVTATASAATAAKGMGETCPRLDTSQSSADSRAPADRVTCAQTGPPPISSGAATATARAP